MNTGQQNPLRILGRVIRQERLALGLTQSQLGQVSGSGLNFVSQLERGKTTVRFDKVLAVLESLGLELRVTRGKHGVSADEELDL